MQLSQTNQSKAKSLLYLIRYGSQFGMKIRVPGQEADSSAILIRSAGDAHAGGGLHSPAVEYGKKQHVILAQAAR